MSRQLKRVPVREGDATLTLTIRAAVQKAQEGACLTLDRAHLNAAQCEIARTGGKATTEQHRGYFYLRRRGSARVGPRNDSGLLRPCEVRVDGEVRVLFYPEIVAAYREGRHVLGTSLGDVGRVRQSVPVRAAGLKVQTYPHGWSLIRAEDVVEAPHRASKAKRPTAIIRTCWPRWIKDTPEARLAKGSVVPASALAGRRGC